MPHSSDAGKDVIRDWLRRLQPTSILDVGCGSGTYSRLFRSLFPFCTWDALEIHEPYVERYQLKSRYEKVIVGDYRFTYGELDAYDVVLFGDVLEHMPHFDALLSWHLARQRSRAVIASIPLGECPQGASEGNAHEAHVSTWDHGYAVAELTPTASAVRRDGGYTIGTYLWERDG